MGVVRKFKLQGRANGLSAKLYAALRAIGPVLLVGLLLGPLLFGQAQTAQAEPEPSPSPTALPMGAPRIGLIDYYGIKKASKEKIDLALRSKVGDPLPVGKGLVEERIELVNGVVRASLQAVCCEQGKAILYVGIQERGAPAFAFRDPPTGEAVLTEEIVALHNEFLEQLAMAVQQGKAEENLAKGHSLLIQHAGAFAVQQKFMAVAEAQEVLLREVLRNSADEVHRAIAATIIGYVPNKATVVDDLQYALQDPDDGVRNNALRSILPIAKLGAADPALRLRVSPTWIIELMNSVIWADRNKAAMALLALTESRDERLLSQIKERAWDAVVDMANWKSLPHSMPGFILAGRCVGVEEEKLIAAWNNGTQAELLTTIWKEAAKKPKSKN